MQSTKVRLVKTMFFPVVMYGCESWTIKKAGRWRIDAFELWYWRRLLRVPWTARRSNQSILKEISPACSLEGLMLKLKLQSFGHLMRRADSFERPWCWERLKARGEGDDRGWDGWMASPTWWVWVWVSSGSWWTGKAGVLPWGRKESDTTEWLNWLTCDCYIEDHRMGNMYVVAGCSIAGYSSRKYLLSYYWLQRRGSEKLEVTIPFR